MLLHHGFVHLLCVLADIIFNRTGIGMCIFHTGTKRYINLLNFFFADIASGKNAAQRNGITRRCLPPFAEVNDFVQTVIGIGKSRFVDDHAGIDIAFLRGLHNLVKRHRDEVVKRGIKKTQQKRSRGEFAGNGDAFAQQITRIERVRCDDERATPATQCTARMQQAILVAHKCKGME